MMDLIDIAKKTMPKLPMQLLTLDKFDRKKLYNFSLMG
jgi:hypothetical protein